MTSSTADRAADYLRVNQDFHAATYGAGYGIQYPESHVVRIHSQVLARDPRLMERVPRLLDFGCGNGTHAAFFAGQGYEVCGIDGDPTAIEHCRRRYPELAARFSVNSPQPEANRDFPGAPFDVIFANQSLYYLGNEDLRATVESFWRQTRPGGFLIATMISTRHYLCTGATPETDGLRRVLAHTRDGTRPVLMNFIDCERELTERLRPFRPQQIGMYDCQIRPDQGSRHHYIFIGRRDGE